MTADRARGGARTARVTGGPTPDLPRSAVAARPPVWALVSSALAPVGMIGGWTLAAAVQAEPFDPARDTISALATSAATSGWIMTTGLALTGACHLATAAGLRAAAPLGRALLALGGLGTLAVAALPVDAVPGGHGLAAGVAFVALAVWPAAATRARAPGPLRRRWSTTASAGLVALLAWFVSELQGVGPADGALTGLTERVLAGAQSVWPLVVVTALRHVGPLSRPAGDAAGTGGGPAPRA